MLYESLLPRKVLERSACGCGAVTVPPNSEIHTAATFMRGGTVSSGMVFLSQLMKFCQTLFQNDIHKNIITQRICSYTVRKFCLKAITFKINLSVTVLPTATFSI
jgi:hypothetical protein